MAEILPPEQVKELSAQIINEGATYHLDLNEFIKSPNEESGNTTFVGELEDGSALPKGLICTSDGVLSGIPAKGTHGNYRFLIIAENESGIPLVTEIDFTIKEVMVETADVAAQFKSKVWEAVKENLPIPDLHEILTRPVTALDVYHLLERFETLTIWDVYNLDSPQDKKVLEINGLNEHYVIYDRGNCLIAAPKDLYSHQRNLEHALQAARLLAQEAFDRDWAIEFAGFDKMVHAAFIELKVLGEKYGKLIEIMHYEPTTQDMKIIETRKKAPTIGPGAEM